MANLQWWDYKSEFGVCWFGLLSFLKSVIGTGVLECSAVVCFIQFGLVFDCTLLQNLTVQPLVNSVNSGILPQLEGRICYGSSWLQNAISTGVLECSGVLGWVECGFDCTLLRTSLYIDAEIRLFSVCSPTSKAEYTADQVQCEYQLCCTDVFECGGSSNLASIAPCFGNSVYIHLDASTLAVVQYLEDHIRCRSSQVQNAIGTGVLECSGVVYCIHIDFDFDWTYTSGNSPTLRVPHYMVGCICRRPGLMQSAIDTGVLECSGVLCWVECGFDCTLHWTSLY